MASNWRDCVGLALGRPLKDKEAKGLEEKFERAKYRRAREGLPDDDAAIGRALAEELDVEAALAKRNVLLNRIAHAGWDEYKTNFKDGAQALRALMGGVAGRQKGARQSIDARTKALFTQYLGGFLADMRKAGERLDVDLVALARSRDFELPLRQALRGETVDGPMAGAAKEVAALAHKYFDAGRLRENRAGSWIGKLDDFDGTQSHDPLRVWRAGHGFFERQDNDKAFKEWADYILPRLDVERTFPDTADHASSLKAIFNHIVADDWQKGEAGDFTGLHKYLGPANLGEKRSAERVLHFKSAEAAKEYNDRFGRGAWLEGFVARMESHARATSLMEVLGPNPEAMFDRIRGEVREGAREEGARGLMAQIKDKHLDHLFAEITGRTRSVVNPTLASWGSSLRVLEVLSKLGAATLSSVGDIASLASQLRSQGKGFLSSYGEALSGLFRGRGDAEIRHIAELLGVGFEGVLGQVHSRFHSTDGATGSMARLQQIFFRWNLLNWWTDAHKTTAGLVTARHYAMLADTEHGGLGASEQRHLGLYGIGAEEWELLRKSAVREAEDGKKFLVPEGIAEIPNEAFATVAAKREGDLAAAAGDRALLRAREELETKWRMLVTDSAEFAVPTPGAAERAWMNFGTERGTVLGEALRFVMQFKGFPIAQIVKGLGREIYTREGDRAFGGLAGGAAARTAEYLALLTAMGYLAMSAKDFAKGKNPADPLDIDTFWKALAQGGGAGLYGDFVFGEFNRFGRSPVETLAGPVIGTAADLEKIGSKALRGEAPKAAELLRFGLQNTPFVNLFYSRMAMDWLFLWNVQESLSPGSFARQRHEAEKRYGQTYWYSR